MSKQRVLLASMVKRLVNADLANDASVLRAAQHETPVLVETEHLTGGRRGKVPSRGFTGGGIAHCDLMKRLARVRKAPFLQL